MVKPTITYNQAYILGRDSFYTGKTNPFRVGTVEHTDWQLGFQSSADEELDKHKMEQEILNAPTIFN